MYIVLHVDQKVSVHLLITIQKSGAQRLFDHAVKVVFILTVNTYKHGQYTPPFNLLKTKRNLLYIMNQSVPRCKHSNTAIKTNHLMTYKAKFACCSEIRTKHSPQSEHHVEILNVKPGGT